MAVDQPDVVDAIGIERDSGTVALAISDHLPWDDDDEHLRMLEAKLNCYLGFIESGELVVAYPQSAGKPVQIDVVCKYPPNERAEQFLAAAREVAEGCGCSLAWRVLASA